MDATAIALTIFALLVAAVWLLRHLQLNRQRHRGVTLSNDSPGPGDQPPSVSLVVAAKDEQDTIETCLRTVLDQDYPNFEVIVCNDRSIDRTSELARAIASTDSRVRVVDIDTLPDGWCGKNHAMQRGIELARGRWICMIDADCRQRSRRTLSVAVAHAVENNIDLLSILPTLEMQGFWETAIQPVCSGTMMIWFRPEAVNDPDKKPAYANGAFMLIRRSVYEAIGTHEAIKGRVSEDMKMAARLKSMGHVLRVVRSEGLYSVRMYRSLGEAVRGWTRIFFGTFGTIPRLTVSFFLLLLMGTVPWAMAAVTTPSAVGSPWPSCAWIACLASWAAVAAKLSVLVRFYRVLGIRPVMALTYPAGNAITLYILIVALTRHLPWTKVEWRGTRYQRP